MRLHKRLLILLLLAVGAVTGVRAGSQTTESAKTCLPLWSIENIDILNYQNIVFRMKNGENYLNRLAQACPMLDNTRAIMYKTPLNSLCSMDIITVLDNVGGGFQSLGACGLGKFQPAAREDIQLLKDQKTGK